MNPPCSCHIVCLHFGLAVGLTFGFDMRLWLRPPHTLTFDRVFDAHCACLIPAVQMYESHILALALPHNDSYHIIVAAENADAVLGEEQALAALNHLARMRTDQFGCHPCLSGLESGLVESDNQMHDIGWFALG